MGYADFACAAATVEPGRAILAAGAAAIAGLVMFIIRNRKKIAERLRTSHG